MSGSSTPPSLLVIDANVAINFALKAHPFHFFARQLFLDCSQLGTRLFAPALWEIEVDNTLRLGRAKKQISSVECAAALRLLDALPIQTIHDPRVRLLARGLADRVNHPRVSDSTYAALADLLGCPFWTADKRFFNAAQGLLSWVHFLDSYPMPAPASSSQP